MNKRYFKILPANKVDAALLIKLVHNKTFYPEATSLPALPGTFSDVFDYRQFFIVLGVDNDGGVIVYTRQEYNDVEFGTNVIPTADWTARYRLSVAPTIVALPEYSEIVNGAKRTADIRAFLSYDYQLYNNF